jgi:hypothetical protein
MLTSRDLLYVSFKHILVNLNSFMGNPNSMRILYNLKVIALNNLFFSKSGFNLMHGSHGFTLVTGKLYYIGSAKCYSFDRAHGSTVDLSCCVSELSPHQQ